MGSSLVSLKKIKAVGVGCPIPMCDLPPEVLVEILARLPVKSLVRFKCVCKSWKLLFESPMFASRHALLRRGSDSDTTLFVVGRRRFSNCAGEKENFLCLLSGESAVTDLDFPLSCCRYAVDLVISGHCDGLVCLHHHDHVLLCNPTTLQFRLLPPSGIAPRAPDESTRGVGFGHDPKTNDYKVVRLLGSDHHPPRVELYSLRSDTWTEIESSSSGLGGARILYHSCSETYLNGVYHWWASDNNNADRIVLTFDMASEVFGRIPLPDLPHDDFLNLSVLNDALALIVQPTSGVENSLVIWAYDPAQRAWAKRSSVRPVPVRIEIPITFRTSDELLLQDADGHMISYNFTTGAVVRFPLRGSLFSFFAAVCVKSLVSINNNTH